MGSQQGKKMVIIGGGFSSLSAACYLAKAGHDVTLVEKNHHLGGRARQLIRDGFTFDMGPTFYWMPDVFESFFQDFGYQTSDFYTLHKLNPAYQVFFGKDDVFSIADNFSAIVDAFEQEEKGSGKKLRAFMRNAEKNYHIAIKDLVYQPGQRITEIMTPAAMSRLGLFFKSIKSQVAQYIKSPKLRTIMEFPVLFLGATPAATPAFYNFMNYADFGLGTWHPEGGMYAVVRAMEQLALNLGVEILTDMEVQTIEVQNNAVQQLHCKGRSFVCDAVLSGADYAHTEGLLPEEYRQYSDRYWTNKTFAPSALLFYVGFKQKLPKVAHHTLCFDTDFAEHAKCIYETKTWPENPLFYASFPSVTDPSMAPAGCEAAVFLIPIAPGIEDTEAIRQQYYQKIMHRMEHLTATPMRDLVLFSESYCVKNFIEDYHAYEGNAYGLANTLLQTHILRPKLASKKLKNMYFTGQLTVPGPGVPPSIISGKIVSQLINKQ